MSQFEYPRLKRAEIVAILVESQIAALSEDDLRHPNPDFVSNLYTRLLLHLDSFLEEDNGQVEFADLERLENPDLHVDSFRIMRLFNRIKAVIAAVECPKKFTLRDLVKPDGDRTEIFVSAMLNFCLFKDSKMELQRPIVEELTTLDEQHKEQYDKITQLNAEIAFYNEAKEREIPLVQEVDSKVNELRQTIADLNNQQMSLRASFRKTKDKVLEMDEKISSAEFALVNSVRENADLRDKIVQSPDKLQRTLEEKKAAREDAKNAERSAMQSYQQRKAVLDVYAKTFRKMSKHYAQMQTIQEQLNSAKSVEKELKALKSKLSDEEMLDKSLEAKLVERQGIVEKRDELWKQLEKERDLKYDEATKEFNKVKSEIEFKNHDLEARQRNIEAVLAEVDAITLKTNSVKESGAAKQRELLHKCEEIKKEFFQYSSSIESVLMKFEAESEVA